MKNNTFLSFIAFLILVSVSFIGCVLLYSNGVSAQGLTPETKCYNNKLNAAGAYVRCLLRAEVNANRSEGEISEEHVERCHQRFENRFTKAEAQAAAKGVVCPSHGGLLPFQKTVRQAAALINLSSSAKTLTVEIASEDLASLQEAGQELNIAIIVNGTFNVVWQSISNYGESNIYQWSPIFQVFLNTAFEDGVILDVIELMVVASNVALGSFVTFQADNTIEVLEPVSGGSTNSIFFNSESLLTLHPSLSQQLTVSTAGIMEEKLPIYVSPIPLFSGNEEVLTPGDEVMVWFEDTITGTIFLVPPSNSIVADLTATNTVTVSFSNGGWTIPDGS